MKKIILCFLLCSALVVIGIIQCFAYYNFTTIPTDIGNKITTISMNDTQTLKKYYLKITTKQDIGNYTFNINTKFDLRDVNVIYQLDGYQTGNEYMCRITGNSYYGITGVVILPYSSIEKQQFTNGVYLPMYLYNGAMNEINDNYVKIEIYESTTIDIDTLRQEAYALGFENGYYDGYNEGFNEAVSGTEQLNLVQHVNKAVSFFIGEEYAPYVTPFAIAFTLLMAYFIFIRWILLFGKSSKALKIADIVVVAACIGIMAVMYINMFTINIHNTNVTESVYQIAQDVAVGG